MQATHRPRVLIIGGNDGPTWVRQSEIYDPLTDTWSSAAPLPVARTRFTAATLPDGRVLVAGGLEQPGPATDHTAPLPANVEAGIRTTGLCRRLQPGRI